MALHHQSAAALDEQLAARFERIFHRPPSGEELRRFRLAEARIHLRLHRRIRRSVASVIATL